MDKNIGLKDVNYQKTKLNNEVELFSIPKYDEIFSPISKFHPFYTYHDQPFSTERFMYSTIPLHLGEFNINYFDKNIVNVLRCPIKKANDRSIYLPKELLFLKEFVEYCCIYETCFNKRFEDLYGHITVDFKEIEKGGTQRVKGWHVDGFQGSKFPMKHEIEHSYLWTSNNGTEFCVQPFFIKHLDESKYSIFNELEKQAKDNNILKMMDKNIYIFDPYMVHRSPIVTEKTTRLIVRITFEYQKLLDPNDTQNPSLEFNVPYKFDIRNRLSEFKVPLNKEMYGFKN